MKHKFFLAQIFALFIVTTLFTIRLDAADNPRQIEGRIHNNIYTAKNNLFSIAIPHPEGSYEYAYMKVKEEFHDEQGAYVSFGPAAFNQSIYRVGLYRIENDNNFDHVSQQLVDNFKLQLENIYQTTLSTETPLGKDSINGKEARHGIFVQKIPVGITISNGKMETLESLHRHEVYVIDHGAFKALVWVQSPDNKQADESMNIVASISPGISPKAFAESLIIH